MKNKIKFKGSLTKENKNILSKEIFKSSILATCIILIIIIPLIVLIAINTYLLIMWFLILPIIMSFGILISPFVTLEPTKEVIIQDNVIYIAYGKFEASRNIQDVKTVIDNGEGYYFKFYFPHKFVYCFCQKDLIVEGTIKEFEELFKNKIIKK